MKQPLDKTTPISSTISYKIVTWSSCFIFCTYVLAISRFVWFIDPKSQGMSYCSKMGQIYGSQTTTKHNKSRTVWEVLYHMYVPVCYFIQSIYGK